MTRLAFDAAIFRQEFDEFADATRYPDATLERYWQQATCFISPVENACLNGNCLRLALNLMTAHICQLADIRSTGKQAGVTTSASIGSVSVSQAPPPFGTSQWSWWLNGSACGAQFNALLEGIAAAGIYIGGSCERVGFRKIGGVF